MSNDLWGGMRIPIIMFSGPVNSGKTLAGLTIDPNCRKPAAEVQPTTLVYDQEGSSDPYVGGLNFEHKDTRAAVGAGVHNRVLIPAATDPRWLRILKEKADCNDSPSASMFRAWYLSILDVPAGRYAVCVCDTFTPLQDGMVDWLRRHPEAFGRTVNEYTKASSMFLWPDVKAMLAHILTIDCRLRFQTTVLNVHLKNEWAGGAKTGKQIAEGLDVLEKLATLHLELDRTPKEKGKDAPRVPSAIVKKERLVRFSPDGNDQPILPPRLPICTPDAIRKYIATPPDFAKLEPGERLPDQSMGDDEKLRLQASIAENNRAAEESHLSALEMARRAMEQGHSYSPGVAPQSVTPPPSAPATAPPSQVAEIVATMKRVFPSGQDAVAWLRATYQNGDPARLTPEQADAALIALTQQLADKQLAASNAQTAAMLAGQPSTSAPPADPTANDRATPEQRNRIRSLTTVLFGGNAATENARFLQSIGVSAGPALTWAQAQTRILELEGQAQPSPNPPDEIPF